MDRELDLQIATEIMGYTWCVVNRRRRNLHAPNGKIVAFQEGKTIGYTGYGRTDLPEYSSDIAAVMEVETHIVEIGLEEEYGDALVWQMGLALQQKFEMGRGAFYGYEVFEIAHATAEQRCHAALAALKTQDGNPPAVAGGTTDQDGEHSQASKTE